MRRSADRAALAVLLISFGRCLMAGDPFLEDDLPSATGMSRATAGSRSGVEFGAMVVDPLGARGRAERQPPRGENKGLPGRSRMSLTPEGEDSFDTLQATPPVRRRALRVGAPARSEAPAGEEPAEYAGSPAPRMPSKPRSVAARLPSRAERLQREPQADPADELAIPGANRGAVVPAHAVEPELDSGIDLDVSIDLRDEAPSGDVSRGRQPGLHSAADDARPIGADKTAMDDEPRPQVRRRSYELKENLSNYWEMRRDPEDKLYSTFDRRANAAREKQAEENVRRMDEEERRAREILDAKEDGASREADGTPPRKGPDYAKPGKQIFRLGGGRQTVEYEFRPGKPAERGEQPSGSAGPPPSQPPATAQSQPAAPRPTFKERWQRFWSGGRKS